MQAVFLKSGSVIYPCILSLFVIESSSGDLTPPPGGGSNWSLTTPPRIPTVSSPPERWCVTNFKPVLLQNVRFRIKTAASLSRRLPLRPHIRRWVTFLRLFDVLNFRRLAVWSLEKAWRGIFTHLCTAAGNVLQRSPNLHVWQICP